MKGRDWLFSADKVVMARPDCWAGAKAEAEPARRAAERVASFIIVKSVRGRWGLCQEGVKDFNVEFSSSCY
jgi:hypothetical protein